MSLYYEKSNHKQNESFHMMNVDNVRLGVSSLGDLILILIDALDNYDKNAKKGNSFNKIIIADLKDQYEELKKFFDYVSELFFFGSEFTSFITSKPKKYTNVHPYNMCLSEVRIQKLVQTFVNRLHYANCKLFGSDNPEEWNPENVIMKGTRSPELISFATELKKFWHIFDNDFYKSFGKAIMHAVEVSKTEIKINKDSEENKEDLFDKIESKKVLNDMFKQELEKKKRQRRGKKNIVLNEDEIWEIVERRYRLKERKEKEKMTKIDKESSESNGKEDIQEHIQVEKKIVIDSSVPSVNMWSKGNPLTENTTFHQERLIKEIEEMYNPKLEKTMMALSRKDNNEDLINRFLKSDKSLIPLELEIVKKIVCQSKIEFDSRLKKQSDKKSNDKVQKKHRRKPKNNKKDNSNNQINKLKKNSQVDKNDKVINEIVSDNYGEWKKVGERKKMPKEENFHQQRKNKKFS